MVGGTTMNEVFIDIRGIDELEKQFTTDLVSVEQLVVCIQNLTGEIDELKEKIQDLQNPEEPDNDSWREYKEKWI